MGSASPAPMVDIPPPPRVGSPNTNALASAKAGSNSAKGPPSRLASVKSATHSDGIPSLPTCSLGEPPPSDRRLPFATLGFANGQVCMRAM